MALTGPCERERTDAELTEVIGEVHTGELHGHPGVRRLRTGVIGQFVGQPAIGHQAIRRSHAVLNAQFALPGLWTDVTGFLG